MMVHADCFPNTHDASDAAPMYFDATPEGSVIFDWDVLPPAEAGHATSSSLPDCDSGTPPQGIEQSDSVQSSKKTRPPKLVREVRDLQDSLKLLASQVNDKADGKLMQIALDQKTNQEDLSSLLQDKATAYELQCLKQNLEEKVDTVQLEEVLHTRVSQMELRDAFDDKVSNERFLQLRHRVKNKLDASFGAMMQGELDQKASSSDFHRLAFNVDGKADRSSMQAALAQKVSWNSMTWRMTSCGVLWGATVGICVMLFAVFFRMLQQQQLKLQQLSNLNEELSSSLHRLDHQRLQLDDTFEQFAAVKSMVKQLSAPASQFAVQGASLTYMAEYWHITRCSHLKHLMMTAS